MGRGYNLFYDGVDGKRNGVGVIRKEEYARDVVEVKCVWVGLALRKDPGWTGSGRFCKENGNGCGKNLFPKERGTQSDLKEWRQVHTDRLYSMQKRSFKGD